MNCRPMADNTPISRYQKGDFRSMFGSKKKAHDAEHSQASQGELIFLTQDARAEDDRFLAELEQSVAPMPVIRKQPDRLAERDLARARAVFALYLAPDQLSAVVEQLNRVRAAREDGTPVLVIGLRPDRLTAFGGWLDEQARTDSLAGVRLIVDSDPAAVAAAVPGKLEPVTETNTIAMPVSTEVDTLEFKYFYCLSPELRGLLSYLRALATNNISRIYLLGGPGAGKTSLAYYFYLCRKQGNFVTVNLTSEATDDKAAMKSLLCGHVSGAFPGAGSRTGAFAHARDGVCFLDPSHGVSGSVMEVLMEALDSGQYLPYGASAKQPLNCAVVFASNRNWDTLISSINIDEHARLGAMIMHLADLAARREDLIAVLAATLDRMAGKCTTWTPAPGITDAAWEMIKACPWHGNTRALMRVTETAFVDCVSHGGQMIDEAHVSRAMALWEPADHASHAIYTSAGKGADPMHMPGD